MSTAFESLVGHHTVATSHVVGTGAGRPVGIHISADLSALGACRDLTADAIALSAITNVTIDIPIVDRIGVGTVVRYLGGITWTSETGAFGTAHPTSLESNGFRVTVGETEVETSALMTERTVSIACPGTEQEGHRSGDTRRVVAVTECKHLRW